MIRIPYEDKPEMTFDDYEIMIACFKDRKSNQIVVYDNLTVLFKHRRQGGAFVYFFISI